MIRNLFQRHKLMLLLAVLLALTAVRGWPRKHPAAYLTAWSSPRKPGGQPGDDPFPEPNSGMRQRMEAALQNLPKEERKAVEERMKADQAFFESVRALPPAQRAAKIQQHFAENPPPRFGPGDPTAGDAGPGALPPPPDLESGGPIQIPPPEIRRSMDQLIANSPGKAGGL
jgi:hypothetical protein